MDNWYYASNGAQVGPVTQEALMAIISSGQVPGDTLVWCTGMAEWVAANSLPQFAKRPLTESLVQRPVMNYGVADSAYTAANGEPEYAGFWIRFGAFFIDAIITNVAMGILIAIEGAILPVVLGANSDAVAVAKGLSSLGNLAIAWFYFSYMLSSLRQASVGMIVVGIRVTDLSGAKITFARATGRYFASILSGCIAGVGFLMIIWSPRNQALHDQIAGTLVLVKRPDMQRGITAS